MDSKQQKTVVGVVLILIFAALMCCGATLMLGAFAGYDEAKKNAVGGSGAVDPTDVIDDDPLETDDGHEPLKDQFAQEVLAGLVDAGHPEYSYVPQRFELHADGGMLINLGNVYDEYAQLEENDRTDFVERTVRTLLPQDIPETWAEVSSKVKVTVRDRLFIELLRARDQDNGVLVNPLADDLVEVVVFDGPDTMSYLNDTHAKQWGKTADQIFAKGRENLAALSTERFTAIAPGVWESPWADNFDTGRAALFEVIRKLKVKGEPVLFLPQRDHLIVTGSNDARGLARAIEAVDERLELPRANSGRGWKLTSAGLEPWVPEEGSRGAFLRADATRNDYNEQKGALDDKFDERGGDVFVATVLEVEDDDNGVHTYCVWTKGAQTLLPRAEYVVFVDLDKPEGKRVVAAASWDDVMTRLGSQVTAEESWWPRRYRVSTYPDVKTIKALGTVSWFTRNRTE